MNTLELLITARERVANAWIQGVGWDKDSGSMCAAYAIKFNRPNDCNPAGAYSYLRRVIGTDLMLDWNDKPGRTQQEVVAAFDKAIDLCRKESVDSIVNNIKDKFTDSESLTNGKGRE